MSQCLPTGKFKWIKQKEIGHICLTKYKDNSKKGLFLEVNLGYQNKCMIYIMAAEKIQVESNYCKLIEDKFNISIGQVHKLNPTLNKIEKYVLHYRNLHLYLDLGLKLKKYTVLFNSINQLG